MLPFSSADDTPVVVLNPSSYSLAEAMAHLGEQEAYLRKHYPGDSQNQHVRDTRFFWILDTHIRNLAGYE